jgi:hypothetical protein
MVLSFLSVTEKKSNSHLTQSLPLMLQGAWAEDARPVITGQSLLAEEIRQDAIDYGSTIDNMIFANLVPVIAAGYTAQRFIGPNGT